MRYLKKLFPCILLLSLLTLAGCSGSSGGGSAAGSDPFASGGVPVGSTGSVIPYQISLIPAKQSVMANEEIIVSAYLRDEAGSPVANQTVLFSVVAGPATALTTSMTTDSNGIALAYVRAGTTVSTTNVIIKGSATVGSSSVTGYANFQLSPADTARLSLAVSSFSIAPQEEMLVTATVRDASGNPLSGQTVNYIVTTGLATMVIKTATTDSNGNAVGLVSAGAATAISNVIVQATTTINTSSLTASIPFQIVPRTLSAQRYSMTLTSSKQTVDNRESFYVTALLKDASNAPVINQTITFSTAIGNGDEVINPASISTDSTGKAIVTVRAGNPANTMAIILKALASINGTEVTALAPVQITTVPQSPSVLKMVLTSNKTIVGSGADVILTAAVTDSQSPPKPIQYKPVTFEIVEGDVTSVDSPVISDSNGIAVSRLKVGTANSSSTIIVKASTAVDGLTVNSYATLTVVRQSSYLINFITSAPTSDPSGNLSTLAYTVASDYIGNVTFKQIVPFQVLDNNGIPKPNVDVAISISNFGRNSDTIIQLLPPFPPYPTTPVTFPNNLGGTFVVKTDDHGMGMFLCNVTMAAPTSPGTANTESIIYQATATVMPENVSLRSYGGFIVTVTKEKAQ